MKNEIAVRSTGMLMDLVSWNVLKEQANVLVRSGFLPSSITKPEQGIAIMMKGIELGIPPMLAFAHINVIKGKPTLSSELMLAQIYKHCSQAQIDFIRIDDTGCTIMAARPGRKQITISFTEEDAKRAGLLGKDTWKAYPRALYRSRAISEMARTIFPDLIAGCSYTPEELDDRYDHEGNVVNVKASSVEQGIPVLKPNLIEESVKEEQAPHDPKIFNRHLAAAIAWLTNELEKVGIDKKDFEYCYDYLDGKDVLTELDPLVKELKKKYLGE